MLVGTQNVALSGESLLALCQTAENVHLTELARDGC